MGYPLDSFFQILVQLNDSVKKLLPCPPRGDCFGGLRMEGLNLCQARPQPNVVSFPSMLPDFQQTVCRIADRRNYNDNLVFRRELLNYSRRTLDLRRAG